MNQQKTLFLLDAFALIFRGYYAFIKNPIINSKGMDTSAIMGFTNSLLDVIKRESPGYLGVCFDKGGSVSRSDIFKEYKANRQETPEAIKIAVPYIQNILKAMNIPVIEKEGYEADDIIGTLAKQAEKEGFRTFMVTPDKDFAQLVSSNIFIYKPARMGNGIEIWGVEEVKAKFEIDHPDQVIDYLGMMGDAVDNIPGLPGVGDKTAKKFLKQFGNMEELLANTDQLKGKLKEKIEANKDLGVLSKKLAKIILDVPVNFNSEEYKLIEPNLSDVEEIFEELEFRRLSQNFKKVFGSVNKDFEIDNSLNDNKINQNHQYELFDQPGIGNNNDSIKNEKNKLSDKNHFYQYVNTVIGYKLLITELMAQKTVSFDTETNSVDSLQAVLRGISFSWSNKKGYYLVLPEIKDEAKKILNYFIPFFENNEIEKVGHNLKYNIKVLLNYNVQVKGLLFDTMIAHYLINPDMRHDLNVLSETYLSYSPQQMEELIGKKGKNQLLIENIDVTKQTEYSVEDADIILQLKNHFEKELKSGDCYDLFKKVEIPLVNVLTKMEMEGINLDVNFLKKLSIELNKEIQTLENLIFEESGEEFNLSSPKQLGIVLYEKLKLVEKPKKTKTGQYSTSEETLSFLAKDNILIANLMNWRSLKKLQNTYVGTLPKEINPNTGRIHTIYNQAVAATGRLSSNKPNLQNIPIRTERGKQIRKAFVSKDNDHFLLAADYSQIELRIIAALSNDDQMIEAFNKNEDIHKSTAAKVFKVDIDKVSREQRNNAKTVNFGIIYGVSAFGLSQQTNLNRSEAKELIETYYSTYPKLNDFIKDQINFARDNGYVETVLGRRRYLNNINSQNSIVRGAAERNAVNAPIQGSAADIIKLAMIKIDQRINKENLKSKMLLQVHDELVFDVPKKELELIKNLVKHEMENSFDLKVPLIVEIGVGKNWLEAH
jgi:DNA polymerase-1